MRTIMLVLLLTGGGCTAPNPDYNPAAAEKLPTIFEAKTDAGGVPDTLAAHETADLLSTAEADLLPSEQVDAGPSAADALEGDAGHPAEDASPPADADKALVVDGSPPPPDDAKKNEDAANVVPQQCVQTLSGVGRGDFWIRFSVQTKAQVLSTLLYQRDGHCGHSVFWEIDLDKGGHVLVATDDDTMAGYTTFASAKAVNDGGVHRVVVARVGGALSILIDDAPSGAQNSVSDLGQLPPLGIGFGNPCEGAGMKALLGNVTKVCLSR